jgi:hypothetical protein
MGSDAMIHVPSFINNGSGIQKLIEEDSQANRQDGDNISLILLFQNKESTLIRQKKKKENGNSVFI